MNYQKNIEFFLKDEKEQSRIAYIKSLKANTTSTSFILNEDSSMNMIEELQYNNTNINSRSTKNIKNDENVDEINSNILHFKPDATAITKLAEKNEYNQRNSASN